MPIADAHVHVDLYLDRARILRDAAAASVVPVIVTTRPSEYRNLVSNLKAPSGDRRLALGLHPEAAGCVYEPFEFAVLESLYGTTRWIGEIGLDAVIADRVGSFFGNVPSLANQRTTFERILAMGVADKVLSVHSQGAESLSIDILSAAGARAVALHWYRGDLGAAARAVDAGYFFSVNPGMMETDAGREILRWLPEDHILLETDGPFTTTEGDVSEPRDVRQLADALAVLRSTDPAGLVEAISDNFERLEARSR